MPVVGFYLWSTARSSPTAGSASLASDPLPGYANTLAVHKTDAYGNDRETELEAIAEGDTMTILVGGPTVSGGSRVFTSVITDTPTENPTNFVFPFVVRASFIVDDEPANDAPFAFMTEAASANAGWPTVAELAQIVNVAPEAAVTDWATTLERNLAAAIYHVKSEVGAWDSEADVPDDNLSGAALRMAELMSQRPDSSNPPTGSDPAYRAFMTGKRKRFGVS